MSCMLKQSLNQCLFVGIDIHKENHLALAANRFEERLGLWEVPNNPLGIRKFLKTIEVLAHQKSLTTIFGVEDSRGNGELLTQYLINNGSTVYEVNPVRTSEGRRKTLSGDKSDERDTEKIIEVLTRKLYELPLLTRETEDQLYTAINELSWYRDGLVREQTKLKNQLHIFFHRSNPDYKQKFKTVFSKKAIKYWQGYSQRTAKSEQRELRRTRALVAQARIERLQKINKELKAIEEELRALVSQTGQKLETLLGINTALAALIIGETREVKRFRTADKYVRYCGIAPQERSSGSKIKYRKSKKGNRRLNHAIYFIALTQLRDNPEVKKYYLKKIAEGKSRRHAISCIMRRIATIIYGMLKNKGEYINKVSCQN